MKRGLVLEGGGAKGAFHCGAVKALYDYGYTFDGVAGTSIGAINGALIVQDEGYESMYDVWTSITAADFTDFSNVEVNRLINREFSKATVGYWIKQALKTVSNLGVPTDKVSDYLHRKLSEDKIRKSAMDYAIVTYCLSDRAPLELFKEDIPEGELHNYILASAYYPAFRLERMNGKYYIDGGVYDNLPLSILPKKGYDEIFAIRTMSKMPYRAITDHNVNVHFICPSEDLGKTVNINQQSLNYKIKLGYYDALRFIKGYAGYKYYINDSTDLFESVFATLDEKTKLSVCELLRIKEGDFLTELAKKIAADDKEDQQKNVNTYVSFFEEIAAFYGIEKFAIYSAREFLKAILDKSVAVDTDLIKNNCTRFSTKAKKISLYQIIIPKISEAVYGG